MCLDRKLCHEEAPVTKLTACGHRFCGVCVKLLLRKRPTTCPLCRAVVTSYTTVFRNRITYCDRV